MKYAYFLTVHSSLSMMLVLETVPEHIHQAFLDFSVLHVESQAKQHAKYQGLYFN